MAPATLSRWQTNQRSTDGANGGRLGRLRTSEGLRRSDCRRILVRRTSAPAYPSGWRYTFHYGALTAGPETLDDGTIRRYDNAHEDTKGHELHAAPDPIPVTIEFPGIEELYERFWDEIPKPRFDPSTDR